MARSELKILIGLHRAVNYIDQQTARICGDHRLSIGQFSVLEALFHKGDLSVGQVQEKILSTSGTIAVIIGNLEARGYVIKERDDKDKRRFILSLTDAGRRLIEGAYPINEERIIEIMGVWTDEEQRSLAALLKKFGDEYDGTKG